MRPVHRPKNRSLFTGISRGGTFESDLDGKVPECVVVRRDLPYSLAEVRFWTPPSACRSAVGWSTGYVFSSTLFSCLCSSIVVPVTVFPLTAVRGLNSVHLSFNLFLGTSWLLTLSSLVLASRKCLRIRRVVGSTVDISASVPVVDECCPMVAFLLVFTVLRSAVNSDFVYSSMAFFAIGLTVFLGYSHLFRRTHLLLGSGARMFVSRVEDPFKCEHDQCVPVSTAKQTSPISTSPCYTVCHPYGGVISAVHAQYNPLLFHGGVLLALPAPTKTIRFLRLRSLHAMTCMPKSVPYYMRLDILKNDTAFKRSV